MFNHMFAKKTPERASQMRPLPFYRNSKSIKSITMAIGVVMIAATTAAPNGVGRTAGARMPATGLEGVFFMPTLTTS